MIIAVLPYRLRHTRNLAGISLQDAFIDADAKYNENMTLGDLSPNDHLIVFTCSRTLFGSYSGLKCKVSLRIAEPRMIQQRYYRLIPFLYRRFFAILTHDKKLLEKLPNAVQHTTTIASISPPHSFDEKSRSVSIIASKRNDLTGHKLRHQVADWAKSNDFDLGLYGRAYKEVANKSEALLPYRFSIIVENNRASGYNTEKLLDCLLCKTVPIYWGDPDVGNSFDTGGMIICTTLDEITTAMTELSPQKYYDMTTAIDNNFEKSLQYLNPYQRISNDLKKYIRTKGAD